MSDTGTEDVVALKARVAELESQRAPTRRFDGRGLTAWVLVVIAAILFPIALTAYWGQRTLTDTQRYVATVAPLAQDPTVKQAVGEKVTAVLVTQIDAQNRVAELLQDNPKLQPLAGPIAVAVNNLVGQTVTKVLDSDQFDQLWITVNTKLQQALISALSNDPTGAVTFQGDQVILDTGDLIAVVKQKLVDQGLSFAANIPVPPVADREVVLLTSPQLKQARIAYAVAQPIAEWLIYATLLLFVVAVLISRKRARMTMAVGFAIILGALAVRLLLAFGQSELELTLSGTSFAVAQQAFFTILTVFLINAIRAAFALGLVLAILGWVLSGTKSALAARRFVGGAVSGAGGRASGTAIAPLAAWFDRTRMFWRFAIVAVAATVILTASPLTGSLILWTAVIAVIAFVFLEFLAAAAGARTADSGKARPEPPAEAAPLVLEGETVDVAGPSDGPAN
jgi:cell division protein FtsB